MGATSRARLSEQKVQLSNPTVTIGMPVFNVEGFLKKALDALLIQTYTDFELIISDNHSTDGTGDICRWYAAQDRRIRYLRQPVNIGAMNNFAYLLQRARGRYFMWAAADDFWAANCLEEWAGVLDGDDSVALVFSNVRVFNHVAGDLGKYYVYPSLSESKRARLLVRFVNAVPSLIYGMFRREAADGLQIASFDYFDLYFGYFMALQGRIVVLHENLYHAGVKGDVRIPYSLQGKKIRFLEFTRRSFGLIWQNFPVWECVFLWTILLGKTAGMYWSSRGKGHC